MNRLSEECYEKDKLLAGSNGQCSGKKKYETEGIMVPSYDFDLSI